VFRRKAFIVRYPLVFTMTTTITNTLDKHKHIIMLAIAVAGLLAYMLPFDNLMGVADAAKKTKDPKKDPNKYPKKDPRSSASTRVNVVQTASFDTYAGGLTSTPGSTSTAVAFNFNQQSVQVCSGSATCTNNQLIDFRPYITVGGS
jgi:hypothetical protein